MHTQLIKAIIHIAKADFLERVRSYGFLVTLLVCCWGAYSFIPPADADYSSFVLNGYGLVYHSAAIGAIMAIILTMLLSLAGYYLVNDALWRDQHTGVAQIIATTQVAKPIYLLGKWLSNVGVLLSVIGVVYLTGIACFFVKGAGGTIEPLHMLLPFVVISLPAAGLTAALAVIGEVLPIHRGLLNVLYFFFWVAVLVRTAAPDSDFQDPAQVAWSDAFGTGYLIRQIHQDMIRDGLTTPEAGLGVTIGSTKIEEGQKDRRYAWTSMRVDTNLLAARLFWLLAGGLAVVIVSPLLRFTPRSLPTLKWRKKTAQDPKQPEEQPMVVSSVPFTALPKAALAFRFWPVLLAELKLLVYGRHRLWYAGVLVGWIGTAVTSIQGQYAAVWLSASWLWQVLVWSSMGHREYEYGTEQYLFATDRPLLRQLPAQWLAGWLIALGTALPLLAADLWTGDSGQLLTVLSGSLLVPAFALCAGIWTKGGKLFEVSYVLAFYLNLNGLPAVDISGMHPATYESGIPLYFVGLAVALTVLAVVGRKRQMVI